ncbi:MAG: hypothetical protein V4607_07910 [Pseudomonadota bacterium]
MKPYLKVAALCAGLIAPGLVFAHSFGRLYNLPVPFWMYAYGAAAALAVSFLLIGYFVSVGSAVSITPSRDLRNASWVVALRRFRLMSVLKIGSLLGLLMCLLTGFFGSQNPYYNFSMTFFWIVFVLGFTYLTACVGDLYASINPWKVMADALNRVVSGFTHGRFAYPAALSHWPALLLYMAFIYIELFAHTKPFSLATILSAYTALNLLGVWLVGSAAWFRYCEFFSVFLGLIARMAPLDYAPGKLRLRPPFMGLLETRAENYALLLFVLFALSSTAFDGLRETLPWVNIFWADKFNILTPILGKPPVYFYAMLRPIYAIYETVCLLLSPFLYLAVYLLFIAMTKWITRSSLTVRELALRFTFSLLPIALVYNITHYYTLIYTQGVKIVSIASDPFGLGWNIFGTAYFFRAPLLPDMGSIWHTQVGLIVFGHIVSVYLAHVEALRTFETPRKALLSQLPMLGLMMLFTASGLWILAQPITSSG